MCVCAKLWLFYLLTRYHSSWEERNSHIYRQVFLCKFHPISYLVHEVYVQQNNDTVLWAALPPVHFLWYYLLRIYCVRWQLWRPYFYCIFFPLHRRGDFVSLGVIWWTTGLMVRQHCHQIPFHLKPWCRIVDNENVYNLHARQGACKTKCRDAFSHCSKNSGDKIPIFFL